jgi:hypothetical protein
VAALRQFVADQLKHMNATAISDRALIPSVSAPGIRELQDKIILSKFLYHSIDEQRTILEDFYRNSSVCDCC